MTKSEAGQIKTALAHLGAPIQKLHNRIEELERWIEEEGERNNVCTYHILKKKTPCINCKCGRFVEIKQ